MGPKRTTDCAKCQPLCICLSLLSFRISHITAYTFHFRKTTIEIRRLHHHPESNIRSHNTLSNVFLYLVSIYFSAVKLRLRRAESPKMSLAMIIIAHQIHTHTPHNEMKTLVVCSHHIILYKSPRRCGGTRENLKKNVYFFTYSTLKYINTRRGWISCLSLVPLTYLIHWGNTEFL